MPNNEANQIRAFTTVHYAGQQYWQYCDENGCYWTDYENGDRMLFSEQSNQYYRLNRDGSMYPFSPVSACKAVQASSQVR